MGRRLLDSTPVPCGQPRETARRGELTGQAGYGWCASHSHHLWGVRLYLLCAPDAIPIAFELAAANLNKRVVAAKMLARVELDGYTVIADKGFAGAECEQTIAAMSARFLRPDRPNEPRRHGSSGAVRQRNRIGVLDGAKANSPSSSNAAVQSQGSAPRVALRLLALAAGRVHNQQIGNPGRHFAGYGN